MYSVGSLAADVLVSTPTAVLWLHAVSLHTLSDLPGTEKFVITKGTATRRPHIPIGNGASICHDLVMSVHDGLAVIIACEGRCARHAHDGYSKNEMFHVGDSFEVW